MMSRNFWGRMRKRLVSMRLWWFRQFFRLPPGTLRRLCGPAPRNDRGAPLDLHCHLLVRMMERAKEPELCDVPPPRAREMYELGMAFLGRPPVQLPVVEDRRYPGTTAAVDVRVYRPSQARDLPCLVYCHGGGFVVGSVDGYDSLCRFLAKEAGVVVVSVGYRLAPEHPFPAALDDCIAALRGVMRDGQMSIDLERIAIGGDSAGASLATAACMAQIDAGLPVPALQVLLCPAIDHAGAYASRQAFASGHYLTERNIVWFAAQYMGSGPREPDFRLAPLLYPRLREMPPTLIYTAGFDPLRDEGEAYAQALADSGVPVYRRPQDELLHSFITMGGVVKQARLVTEDLAEELRQLLLRVSRDKMQDAPAPRAALGA